MTDAATIVVGDATLGRQLTAAGAVVVDVPDYLHAVGELSRRPGSAVVGTVDKFGRTMEPTVRALRTVSPNSRLVLVADAAEEPQAMQAVRLGCGDYHIRPVDAGRLVAGLNGGGEQSPPKPRASRPAASPMPTEMSSLLDDLLAERPLRQRLLDRLEDVAGGDVQLLADPPIEREDDAVPVRVNNHHFGYLIGHDVPASRLAAHAADLARWLAVERKIAELKELAYKDDLTGAWNRRYFDKAFRSIVRHAADHRFRVTLLLFDIDDFKHFNDTYGHPAGDEILQECARLMMSVVRKHDIVARIGGDEFAVIFWDAEGPRKPNSEHPQSIRRAAARFQRAVCEHRFPKLADCAPGTLTTSGGLASFPWDGRTVEELFDVADKALLESKRQGKNAITFGNGADRICPDDLTDEDGGEPES